VRFALLKVAPAATPSPWVAEATLVGPLPLSDPYRGGALIDPDNYKADPNGIAAGEISAILRVPGGPK
jgi:hypothetical protein